MILTGPEIKKEFCRGRISIEPFTESQINPNSYNYRIGRTILEIENKTIDPKEPTKFIKKKIDPSGFILYPGKAYLANTLEFIGSNHYMMSLIGRSTMGRLGLWLQACADLGHVGTRQRWTLELKVVQPLIIYPLMVIGQVSFWKITGRVQRYEGKYNGHVSVSPSLLFSEFSS